MDYKNKLISYRRNTTIMIVVISILVIAGTVLLTNFFTSRSYLKIERNQFKEIIKGKDSTIYYIKEQRALTNQLLDTLINQNKASSVRYIQQVTPTKTFQSNQTKYENVANTIRNYTRDSLRRAVDNY